MTGSSDRNKPGADLYDKGPINIYRSLYSALVTGALDFKTEYIPPTLLALYDS